MLLLHDRALRLALLNHLTWRLRERSPAELDAAGIDRDALSRLKQSSTMDLGRLAARRELVIGVRVDPASLRVALKALAQADDAVALETYFLRHGASWQMMRAFFRSRRKETYKRRLEVGAWKAVGRKRLPDLPTRAWLFRLWLTIDEPDIRLRYFRLHQKAPHLTIAELDAVIRRCQSAAANRERAGEQQEGSDP